MQGNPASYSLARSKCNFANQMSIGVSSAGEHKTLLCGIVEINTSYSTSRSAYHRISQAAQHVIMHQRCTDRQNKFMKPVVFLVLYEQIFMQVLIFHTQLFNDPSDRWLLHHVSGRRKGLRIDA